MNNIDLEIIILNYNNANDTINLTKQLIKQKNVSFHIVVVDNCSPDGSYENLLLLNDYDCVTVIKSDYNGGYAYGNNFGMKLKKNYIAKYIAILNNDLLISNNNLFNELIKEYNSLKSPAFIAPAQIEKNGLINLHCGRKKPSFLKEILNSFLLYVYFFSKQNAYELNNSKETMEVEILSGAFLFAELEYFKEIDYFDEGTFLFLEERILNEKVLKTNKKNYLIRKLGYEHLTSVSINNKYSNIGQAELYNNGLLYYTKKYTKYGKLKYLILLPLTRLKIFQLKLLNVIRKFKND